MQSSLSETSDKMEWFIVWKWTKCYRIWEMLLCNIGSILCAHWLSTSWLYILFLCDIIAFFCFFFSFPWLSGWQYKASFHLSGSDSWRGDTAWWWGVQATFWHPEKQRLLLGFPNYTGSALGSSTGAFSHTCLYHVLPTGRSVSTLTH